MGSNSVHVTIPANLLEMLESINSANRSKRKSRKQQKGIFVTFSNVENGKKIEGHITEASPAETGASWKFSGNVHLEVVPVKMARRAQIRKIPLSGTVSFRSRRAVLTLA